MSRLRFLLLATALLFAAHSAHAQGYTYEAFDYPGATDTSPQAIDGTSVAGWWDATGGTGHGFTYDTVGHTFTTFNDPSGTEGTFATSINGTTVLGQASNSTGTVSFTYDTGTHVFTDFSVFGSNSTAAYGINGGNIAGFYRDGDNIERGFLLPGGVGGTPTSISYPGAANTEFFGITGNRIVGQYMDGINPNLFQGFIYNVDTLTYTILHNPAAPGINATVPTGLSGNLVTGYYFDGDTNYVGFLYNLDTDTYTNLAGITPNLGVQPNGLSGLHVVGSYFDGTTGAYRGFVATVPEPADFALAAGLLALGCIMHRRRR